MNNPRSNTVMIGLIGALIAPHIEECCHIKLSTEDVAALIGLGMAGWHAAATAFEHYFPPKVPFTQPEPPAKEPT